jgi:hypothetical protein
VAAVVVAAGAVCGNISHKIGLKISKPQNENESFAKSTAAAN